MVAQETLGVQKPARQGGLPHWMRHFFEAAITPLFFRDISRGHKSTSFCRSKHSLGEPVFNVGCEEGTELPRPLRNPSSAQ